MVKQLHAVVSGVTIQSDPSEPQRSQRERANREANRWHVCNNFPFAVSVVLNKLPTVIMPVGFTFTSDGTQINLSKWGSLDGIVRHENLLTQLKNLNPEEVLDGCIRRCAKAHLVHKDIEWRHVAVFPQPVSNRSRGKSRSKGGEEMYALEPGFIDLTRMDAAASENDAIKKMRAEKKRLLSILSSAGEQATSNLLSPTVYL